MRIALLISCVLIASCNSQQPQQEELVTLDGATGGAQPAGSVSAGGGTQAPATRVQAVTAEGPRLEPLLSSAISAAGLESGSCRFSPAQGALPVLVASTTGAGAIVSVAGRQIDVAPSAAVTATGGSFAAQGISLAVAADRAATGAASRAGSAANMKISDADGPAFTYLDGFWACT